LFHIYRALISANIINSHTGFKHTRAVLDRSSLDFATTFKRQDVRSWPGRHPFVVSVHAELFQFYHKTADSSPPGVRVNILR